MATLDAGLGRGLALGSADVACVCADASHVLRL